MCKGVDDGFSWGEENKDRIVYYTCGHSSEGGLINLDEENRTAILEMIEKGVVFAFGGACSNCLKKERAEQTMRVLQQTGLLPD